MPSQKQAKVQPFCAVCQSAGKSIAEYTNHFVRSDPGPSGVVVCPTLLSQSCGFCGGKGHTPKYCQELTKKKVDEAKAAKLIAIEKRKSEQKKDETEVVTRTPKKSNNMFAAAFDDSDSETDKKKVSKKTASSVVTKKTTSVQVPTPSAPIVIPKKVMKPEEFPALPSKLKNPTKVAFSQSDKPHYLEAVKQVFTAKKPEVPAASNNNAEPAEAAASSSSSKKTLKSYHYYQRSSQEIFVDNFIKLKLEKDVEYQKHIKHENALNAKMRKYKPESMSEEEMDYYEGQSNACNGWDVSEYYEEAIKAYNASTKEYQQGLKASTMDWAAEEEDSSDDEDW